MRSTAWSRGCRTGGDLITAVRLVEGGPNVNQELGQILNKTPRRVSKLKEYLLAIDGVAFKDWALQIERLRVIPVSAVESSL